jgi:DNA-binding CsgD family transcriptional regulator
VEDSRLTCQHCLRPLTLRAPRLCPACTYTPDMEERAAYVAHDLLTTVQPHVEAKRFAHVLQGWLVFQREVGQIAIDHAPPTAAQGQRVKPEADTQIQWRKAVSRYKHVVALETAPAAEFCLLFSIAADMRTHYLQRLMTPQPTLKLVSDTYAFEWYNRVFVAGLCFTDPPAPQFDLHQAVKAMRKEMFEGLGWMTGAMQEHPLTEVREWGSILFSGVMRSMITMNFPGLQAALAQEGNPEEVLLERLLPTGYASWYDGSRESLEAIRNRIVAMLKHNDSQNPREDHTQHDALHQGLGEALSPTPEDPLRLLELKDLVKAWCRQAECTAYETEIVYYKLQDYSERAIAAELGHSEDGITQAWRSARAKLKTVSNPEEWRRLTR